MLERLLRPYTGGEPRFRWMRPPGTKPHSQVPSIYIPKHRAYYAANKTKIREKASIALAGLFNAPPKSLACDVCGACDRRMSLDHSHSTGKFRGWLCINCNSALGMAKDDPELLRKLAVYLEKK